MQYSQSTGAKDDGNAHFAADRHLQVPDEIDGYTEHRDVGDGVEDCGCVVEANDIQTAAGGFLIPDFPSWGTLEDGDEEKYSVEEGV